MFSAVPSKILLSAFGTLTAAVDKLTFVLPLSCVCVRGCVRACACVRVCEREREREPPLSTRMTFVLLRSQNTQEIIIIHVQRYWLPLYFSFRSVPPHA